MLLRSGEITPLTQKVIWAGGLVYGLGTALRGAVRDRNAMANGDGVVSDQDVFHNEPNDSLTLNYTQRISSSVQAVEKGREGLGEAKEGLPIISLVSDCLQLDAERLFTLAERRHTLAQLLDRHERFLVGAEKSFDALANMRQFSLQALLTFLCRIGRTRCFQPTVKFLLYQRGVFQQSNDFGPDDLIEQILPDETAVVANRAA